MSNNRDHRHAFFAVLFVFGVICLVAAIVLMFAAIWEPVTTNRQLHGELAGTAAACGVLGVPSTWIGTWGVFFAR